MWSLADTRLFHHRWLHSCACLGLSAILLATLLLSMQQPVWSQTSPPTFCSPDKVTQIPLEECQALEVFYQATGGPTWFTQTGWLQNYAFCSWYGITCVPASVGSNVGSIILPNNNLTGNLPEAIGDFSELQQLDLRDNSLTGAIPLKLCQLKDLTFLFLGGQNSTVFQYEGPLPNCLGDLSKLTSLKIVGTKITGPIPPELGKLSRLVNLFLASNQLTGQIPPTLTTNMTNLVVLDLAHNQLVGPIPTELGKLKNLEILTLYYNQLSGQIPAELGNLTKTIHLQLQHNLLQGPIPASLGKLVNARTFRLDDNALTGTVPSTLVNVGSDYLKTPGNPFAFSLDHNLLRADDPALGQFLLTHNSSFTPTQTLPPTNLSAGTPTATDVTLTWKPLGDTTNAGNYTIGIGDSPTNLQPWVDTSKNTTSTVVTKLCPGATYYAGVRTRTAPHNLQQNDLVSEWSQTVQFTMAARDLKLLSIYILALDNDLDSRYESLVHAIEQATAEDTNKVALILADRQGVADTQILSVECGKRTERQGLPDLADFKNLHANLQEYNMTDPGHLAAFLKWARFNYPAVKNTVTYISHGVALAPAVDIAKYMNDAGEVGPGPNGIFPIPGGQDIHTGQVSDNYPAIALISPYLLTQALRIATDDGVHPFTVLDIVHCFGGTIEELYELSNPEGRPLVETIVSSPNYAYSGPELLRRAMLAVQPGQTAQQMATALVNAYHQALVDASTDTVQHPHLIVAVQPTQTITLKESVDTLARAIMTSFVEAPEVTLEKLQIVDKKVAKYNTTICTPTITSTLPLKADFVLDFHDGLADLADFSNKLSLEFTQTLEVQNAAARVVKQLDLTIIPPVGRASGNPWFAHQADLNWPFDDASRYQGIAIYADFHGMTTTIDTNIYLGWQAHWYTAANKLGDNPYPYAFVRIGQVTWADVLHRFWQNRTQNVKTVICTTVLPNALSYKGFLPLVTK